jgi:hypothetical protein
MITMTLPDDVIDFLKTVHTDPAWAVVKLAEQARRRVPKPVALAELVQLPQRRALIMVNADVLRHLPGVAIIPLSDGRGILALDAGMGVADLEIAVIDRLDAGGVPTSERQALDALRTRLREWRQDGVQFEARAIIVARRTGPDTPVSSPAPIRAPASKRRRD